MGQQQHEFVAPVSEDQVCAARLLFQTPGELDQTFIAARMSECIVDALEMIQVEQQQREWQPIAAGAIHFLRQALFKQDAGVSTGQWITGDWILLHCGLLRPCCDTGTFCHTSRQRLAYSSPLSRRIRSQGGALLSSARIERSS